VISTIVVFFLTWLLHAVQWFWLRGSFLWAANDSLFWAILAGLVVINSLWEMSHGRARQLTAGDTPWRSALWTGLKTLATFTILSLLWSLWTSESLGAWLSLWQFAKVAPTSRGWLLIATAVTAIFIPAVWFARNPVQPKRSLLQEAIPRSVVIVLLCAVSIAAINRHLGAAGKWIASAKEWGLNQVEMAELERGYYEDLLDVDRFNGELWMLYLKRPRDWEIDLTKTGMTEWTKDLTLYKLRPSVEGTFKGARFRTNRWGMHDKEYDLQTPNDCYRIAVLGASYTMGSGVERELVFEAVLEDRLNKEKRDRNTSFEILNFAVGGYRPLAQVSVLEQRVLRFKPKMVMLVGHPGDSQRATYGIVAGLWLGIEPPQEYLRDYLRKLGITANSPETVTRRKLAPHATELMAWAYREIVRICREHDAQPVYVLLPENGGQLDGAEDLRIAAEAGFTTLDLNGVYGNRHWKKLAIAEWDGHPNIEGHQLIANRLYDLIRDKSIVPGIGEDTD
jgi:hypothetical protein